MTSDEIALPLGRIIQRCYPWEVIDAGTGIDPWLVGAGGSSAKGIVDRRGLSLAT